MKDFKDMITINECLPGYSDIAMQKDLYRIKRPTVIIL